MCMGMAVGLYVCVCVCVCMREREREREGGRERADLSCTLAIYSCANVRIFISCLCLGSTFVIYDFRCYVNTKELAHVLHSIISFPHP